MVEIQNRYVPPYGWLRIVLVSHYVWPSESGQLLIIRIMIATQKTFLLITLEVVKEQYKSDFKFEEYLTIKNGKEKAQMPPFPK